MSITVPADLYGSLSIPSPISIQSFLWTTPQGFFPTNFNQNILYRDITSSTNGSQEKMVPFRGINCGADFTDPASARIVTIINNNGDEQEIIVNAPGWQPCYGWGIVSVGASIDVSSLQVGI